MVDTLTQPSTAQPSISSSSSRSGLRLIVRALLGGVSVLFIAEVLRVFIGSNFHTVQAGRCFRAAQPTPHSLQSLHDGYGIRSIVNLRGDNPDDNWYRQEKATAEMLGIQLFDAGLWSKEHSPTDDFRIFVRAIRNAEEPILIHCANGNDRSALGSAVYLLLRTDASVAEARGQFSMRFGHFSFTRAACLQRILDNYEAWLQAQGSLHSADNFFFWAMNQYEPETPG